MITLLEYVQGLAALTVEGVRHDFGTQRPLSLKGALLPAKWLELPTTDRERMAFDVTGATAHGKGRIMRVRMVIPIQAIGEGLPEPNFLATVAMSDAVTLAVTKADVAMSWPSVSCEATQMSMQGGQEWYWALVATVEATG